MDENFPAKCFKSNNHATSGSEHISMQFVGFKIPDKSMVVHLFYGFTDASCRTSCVGIRHSQ